MILAYILGAVIVVSLISLIGVVMLFFKEKNFKKMLLHLVSFAAGAMLAAAFLDLLPEAVEMSGNAGWVLGVTLFSIVLFFVIEKFLYWFHCHDGHCELEPVSKHKKRHKGHKHHHHHVHPVGYINLVGDGLHNFLDGALIAGAFLANIPLGIITTVAVILHEIPQEVGDFGVLVYAGFTKKRALLFNFLSALVAIAGALAAFFFAPQFALGQALLLSLAAGSFIYIGAADLLPELHRESEFYNATYQLFFFVLGIVLIWLTGPILNSIMG